MEKLVEALRRVIVVVVWILIICFLLLINQENVEIIWKAIVINSFDYENLKLLDLNFIKALSIILVITIGMILHDIVNWIFQKA
ncbi:MAG: hypothetical protein CML98_00655 [Rhodobiaceae bacterium]|nr:hypothetical protein [Rhodobiaceae bacterium]|tara:strand:- start:1742 stop:1993 length:252 start_codon:yes stop_codon:yes gene_type:complete